MRGLPGVGSASALPPTLRRCTAAGSRSARGQGAAWW
jgi:hypothetical protein